MDNDRRLHLWPKTKRLTVEVLTQNQSTVAFWRAMGYRDYSLALEIMPRKRRGEWQKACLEL